MKVRIPLVRGHVFGLLLCSLGPLGCEKTARELPQLQVHFDADSPQARSGESQVPARSPASRAQAPAEPVSKNAPDPQPRTESEQVVYVLSYQEGELRLRSGRRISLGQAQSTPRVVGRFAVELLRGEELIERVRFDFPLLGGGEGEEVFETGLRAEREVMVPWLPEVTRARWYDRKTRAEGDLPYPP